MENEETTIDLGRLFRIMWLRKKVVAGILVVCTAAAGILTLGESRYYESTALVQTRNAGKDVGLASAMGINVGGNVFRELPLNYVELMKSRTVIDPVIDSMEWDEQKTKPTADQFAKDRLKIDNIKQTTLITVTAKGKTPEEAQKISQGVVDNFLLMQANMSRQTQSVQVKLLNEQIDKAKKEADDEARKLAQLSSGTTMESDTYRELEQDAKIKNDIYLNLVKQCEQDKVQETLESMDIQIIDAASLPDVDKPAPSKKKGIIGIGALVGCLVSLGYALIVYKWGK